eukprot:GDKJ01057475.1.p1 GENE.GDKJ01057475.1~~GDKJ01057475.1.p1  ORF type:complete len:1106 (-),score=341.72 GDKJ01057475.1:735-3887(-)
MNILYKTKLCANFKMGKHCPTGDDCHYAHSEAELRPTPNFTRTTMCKLVVAGEECLNDNCRFAHSREELRTSELGSVKLRMCNFHAKGRCKDGENCRFAHDLSEFAGAPLYKTRRRRRKKKTRKSGSDDSEGSEEEEEDDECFEEFEGENETSTKFVETWVPTTTALKANAPSTNNHRVDAVFSSATTAALPVAQPPTSPNISSASNDPEDRIQEDDEDEWKLVGQKKNHHIHPLNHPTALKSSASTSTTAPIRTILNRNSRSESQNAPTNSFAAKKRPASPPPSKNTSSAPVSSDTVPPPPPPPPPPAMSAKLRLPLDNFKNGKSSSSSSPQPPSSQNSQNNNNNNCASGSNAHLPTSNEPLVLQQNHLLPSENSYYQVPPSPVSQLPSTDSPSRSFPLSPLYSPAPANGRLVLPHTPIHHHSYLPHSQQNFNNAMYGHHYNNVALTPYHQQDGTTTNLTHNSLLGGVFMSLDSHQTPFEASSASSFQQHFVPNLSNADSFGQPPVLTTMDDHSNFIHHAPPSSSSSSSSNIHHNQSKNAHISQDRTANVPSTTFVNNPLTSSNDKIVSNVVLSLLESDQEEASPPVSRAHVTSHRPTRSLTLPLSSPSAERLPSSAQDLSAVSHFVTPHTTTNLVAVPTASFFPSPTLVTLNPPPSADVRNACPTNSRLTLPFSTAFSVPNTAPYPSSPVSPLRSPYHLHPNDPPTFDHAVAQATNSAMWNHPQQQQENLHFIPSILSSPAVSPRYLSQPHVSQQHYSAGPSPSAVVMRTDYSSIMMIESDDEGQLDYSVVKHNNQDQHTLLFSDVSPHHHSTLADHHILHRDLESVVSPLHKNLVDLHVDPDDQCSDLHAVFEQEKHYQTIEEEQNKKSVSHRESSTSHSYNQMRRESNTSFHDSKKQHRSYNNYNNNNGRHFSDNRYNNHNNTSGSYNNHKSYNNNNYNGNQKVYVSSTNNSYNSNYNKSNKFNNYSQNNNANSYSSSFSSSRPTDRNWRREGKNNDEPQEEMIETSNSHKNERFSTNERRSVEGSRSWNSLTNSSSTFNRKKREL